MKLKLSIRYRTSWGESLHADIRFYSQDGTVRHQNFMMQTDDGELWTLEAVALSSRQHPVSRLTYYYQVENADGEVLRQEWNEVPRTYYCDSSQDYVFPDQWRDRPLPYHLYSNAYLTTIYGRHGEQVEATRMPLFRQTVIFRVSAPQLKRGQAVAVCGSHPSIGSWNTSRYLQMQYIGQHEWMLSVNAMGWLLPIEYKYLVVDTVTHDVVQWEEGDNRIATIASPDGTPSEIAEGQVLVLYGDPLRICEAPWRLAGVSIPVFSLRSEHSYGVGDFGDLRRLVDWADVTGMKVIQLLPVNDTTVHHNWDDSCPYNIVSMFALHPHYVDLEAAGALRSKQQMTQFLRRRQELNALPYSDYEAVDRVKNEYLQQLFEDRGKTIVESKDFKAFVADNEQWLKPYAQWLLSLGSNSLQLTADFVYYVQYLLHTQLLAAADYAREKGIVLKGDLPIGVSRHSVELQQYPTFFHQDSQTGAPPDIFSRQGQNWGFPTYQWSEKGKVKSEKGEELTLTDFMKRRLKHLSQYFDAIRIDHVLGYFRIWEIPAEAIDGVLGHFSPALPLTAEEIAYFGLPFRKELMTHPFINDAIIDRLFGIHADYVCEYFLVRKAYNLYDLQEECCTQQRVADYFADRRDENSLWIRDGLMRLIANVLFVEDSRLPEMYHPRINAFEDSVFDVLTAEEKDAYLRLYNNYYSQRHSFFWGHQAMKRLTAMLSDSRLLACGEDLGMLPDCVEPVLDHLRILTLEIQQMPKHPGFEYTHLESNPIRSVCTISTHDMSPLRLWWQENPERRQRYYITMLQKEGRAPEQLPAHLAEEIIARHLYCPSMLCILQLQDWLAMDGELRGKRPQDERINTPSDPYNRWQYRMHLTIEQLLAASRYNNKVKTMITRSRR